MPLTTHVLTYADVSKEFFLDAILDKRVLDVLNKFSKGKPALVFCHSRKNTKVLAQLLQGSRSFVSSAAHHEILAKSVIHLEDASLKSAVMRGVAWHNASLSLGDRQVSVVLFIRFTRSNIHISASVVLFSYAANHS